MTKFIGISGPINSGKSSFARAMKEALTKKGYSARIMHNADPLKDACADAFNVPRDYFEDRILKEADLGPDLGVVTEDALDTVLSHFQQFVPSLYYGKGFRQKWLGHKFNTPREIAQYVGTEWLRIFDPDVHIKALVYSGRSESTDFVVVGDTRFMNEQEAMDHSFYVVRPEVETAFNALDIGTLHASEKSLPMLRDNAHHKVMNAGAQKDLLRMAEFYASLILGEIPQLGEEI